MPTDTPPPTREEHDSVCALVRRQADRIERLSRDLAVALEDNQALRERLTRHQESLSDLQPLIEEPGLRNWDGFGLAPGAEI